MAEEGGGKVKIQTFQITIAVPDDMEFVKPDKLTSALNDYSVLLDTCVCAIEVKEIEKYIEVEE